ncbi:MAG: hypothetical protein M1825_002144 [Sarcosagium campestre]|nr:MAG: hypothetical protein M1825_002144 [Sarcosagium campestre]
MLGRQHCCTDSSQIGEVVTTIPTIGFNVESVTYKNLNFNVWDLGGQTTIRPYWRCYYANTAAVIFVIDSTDIDRLGTASEELAAMLNEEELRDAALLVFANKQDQPGAKQAGEISEALRLGELRDRNWSIMACSAVDGRGITEGMDWLVASAAAVTAYIMASGSSARQNRAYIQDYIARIRYSNALPPPPLPPKLLDIPNTGVSSGQYTAPGYGARLVKEQPLNIEADAELGMPLDLVGMPGIFDGDESSIQAPDHTPAPHPRDKPLLRPLSSLGKPTSVNSGVSFLRRTEYISYDQRQARSEAAAMGRTGRAAAGQKRRRPDVSQEDPTNILRTMIKGFDISHPESAYTGPDVENKIRGHAVKPDELHAWKNPQHPTKKHLTVLDTYPILPDLDAFTDTGGYIIAKFATNPVAVTDKYDRRLDFGLLRPMQQRPELQAVQDAALQAHLADPSKPHPGPPRFDYELFIPDDAKQLPKLATRFSTVAPDRDDSSLYTYEDKEVGRRSFRYGRVRAYETTAQSGDFLRKYDEIAIALYDPEDHDAGEDDGWPAKRRMQKGAYYYPVVQKTHVRPRRATTLTQLGMVNSLAEEEAEAEKVDFIDITVTDAEEQEAARRLQHRHQYASGGHEPE